MGLLLPLLLSYLSNGFLRFLTFLQFEGQATTARIAKKGTTRLRSGIEEWDLALIAYWGTCFTLLLALVTNFLPVNPMLAKYALYYAAFNLIPFSQLDGMKIFIGTKPFAVGKGAILPLYLNVIILTIITALIVLTP